MKKQILTIMLMSVISIVALAQVQCGSGVKVDNVEYQRHNQKVTINMNIDLRSVSPVSDNAIVITPIIIRDNEIHELNSLAVYGRNRYYYYVRNNKGIMITGPSETSYLSKQRPDNEEVHIIADYAEWMDNSKLCIRTQLYGCCGDILEENTTPAAFLPVFHPSFIYITPNAERIKKRNISGRAFIDFKVNKTDICENYRANASELSTIRQNIDTVKNDADIEVKSIYIKGFASPEGSYNNNVRLSKERTKAVKKYVEQLYDFPKDFVRTSYEAEDWAGFIEAVKKSTLTHKAEILKLINKEVNQDNIDRIEQTIRIQYPEDYKYILRNIYPALRHTDYEINFVIRKFSNIEEICRLVETNPRKLSLNEFYLASTNYEEGSEEFNKIFQTAALIYPMSEVANLNAAVACLGYGDFKGAAEYLRHAGSGAEAQYTRGLYNTLSEHYVEAEPYFRIAADAGIEEALEALEQLKNFK